MPASPVVGTALPRPPRAHPERLPTLVLTGRFLDDYLEMLDRWAACAQEVVGEWPDDPAAAEPDLASLTATVEQAQRWIDRIENL